MKFSDLSGQEVYNRLGKIIIEVLNPKKFKMIEKNINFAHYTSAETAFKIFKNEEVWLRSPSYMNDVKEIEHGVILCETIISKFKEQICAYNNNENFFWFN